MPTKHARSHAMKQKKRERMDKTLHLLREKHRKAKLLNDVIAHAEMLILRMTECFTNDPSVASCRDRFVITDCLPFAETMCIGEIERRARHHLQHKYADKHITFTLSDAPVRPASADEECTPYEITGTIVVTHTPTAP